VGDRPVLHRVVDDVGVEQQDRYAADLGEPDRDRQLPAGELQLDGEWQTGGVLDPCERQAAEVVVGVACSWWPSASIDWRK
jgi:hypothetical protein